MDAHGNARELFTRYRARYEVSQYFVVLDDRTFGVPPSRRRIPAGFDLDLYSKGTNHGSVLSFENGDLRSILDELYAACREAVTHAAEDTQIEIIPFEETLVLNTKSHFDPEALVRIRISHSRGLDQPAGASEDEARAAIVESLDSMGVKKT